MKLMNDFSLQKLCKDPSYPISAEGQMNFRRSNMEEKFQKRYFVLKGNLLFYFAKKSDKSPIGLIVLEGYTVELSSDEDGHCFQLIRRRSHSSTTNHKASFTFLVPSAESLESWLKTLTNCSYEQSKMAAERLSELEADSSNASSEPRKPKDENHNQLQRTAVDEPKPSFDEIHEEYGHKIQELLSASQIGGE